MKKLQILLYALGMCIAMTYCSKEEVTGRDEAEKVSVAFGAMLQDLQTSSQGNKQTMGVIPECTNEDAAYVRVIISREGVNVVGTQTEPFRIDLVTNQLYTQNVPEMKLSPGTYSLDYFGVYNAAGQLIWLAPSGGVLSEYLDDFLPIPIQVNAGVKKYVDVPVLCYDARFINEYGYIFFDIDTNRIIEFCILGNYCDQGGRHYPAAFSVNVWAYSNGVQGEPLYSNAQNSVALNEAGDYAGTPLCVALPDTPGPDEYYFEINLLNSDAYGDVTEEIIRSGVITDEDVRSLFDGAADIEYYHFKHGACNAADSPALFDAGAQNLTKKYSDEVATAWFDLLADLTKTTFYFPPQSARLFAYSGLSLYESVLPGMPSYQSVFSQVSGQSIDFNGDIEDYYWPASANSAVAELARRLLQDYPQPVNLPAINQLESELLNSFPSGIFQDDLERSISFGKQVAEAVYKWSLTDGTFTPCPPYTPLGGPGNWVPTPPAFIPASASCLKDLRTFVPGIADALLAPPPPAYSTDPDSEFYQMNLDTYELTQNLTAEDHRIIQSWRDNPPLNYNGMSHIIALATDLLEDHDTNLEEAAVLYVQLGMALYDAIPPILNSKYEYSLLRPVTYIRDVLGYTDWESVYPAPPHPSYPSIGLGVNSAGIKILEAYFGENFAFEDATQEELYGVFYYNSFDELLDDIALSRTHSGINYQISVDFGEEIGRAVGEQILAIDYRK